jgi:hypothetical protein
MNRRFDHLVNEYLNGVVSAVALLSRSGIPIPHIKESWVRAGFPKVGVLDGGVAYFKHGVGCEVALNSGVVDFDFGDNGEIDDIELFRLVKFSKENLSKYGYAKKSEIEEDFKNAVDSGFLTCFKFNTYHLTGRTRLQAKDVDCRLPGDLLPPIDKDIILTIHSHNFLPANLMRQNYQGLDSRWDDFGRLSGDEEVNYRIYLFTWLGFLFETCKWFKKKNIRRLLRDERPEMFRELTDLAESVIKMASSHECYLQDFRNNVFHFPTSEAVHDYFDKQDERLLWSHELHEIFSTFFSRYRVLCTVHYALNGRKGELRSFIPEDLRS